MTPECKTREQVLRLPFLSSLAFHYNSRPLVSCHLAKAGICKLKDVINPLSNLDINSVFLRLKEKKINFKKQVIVKVCKRVKACILPEWHTLLTGENCEMQDNAAGFLLCLNSTFGYNCKNENVILIAFAKSNQKTCLGREMDEVLP